MNTMNKNVQKLVALAVLVIFALSIVPAAFAEREEVKEKVSEKAKERIRDSQDTEKKVELVKERANERAEQVRENMKENLKEAKQRYEEAKESFKEKKEQLSELKQKARCKEESEDCHSKKLDLKRGVKEHLIKTIELIDRSLAKLKEQVNNSKVLSEEEKQEALQKIADLEMQLAVKKMKLENLTDSLTNEELRTQIKELKDLWHTVRKEQRWIVTQLINAKQDNLVDIYVNYGERAEAQITKLVEQGAEVATLQELLTKYQAKVGELKIAQGEANTAWLEAKSSPEAMEKAKKLQDAFKAKAKEVKAVLRELLKKIKEVQRQIGSNGEESGETESAVTEPAESQPATPAAGEAEATEATAGNAEPATEPVAEEPATAE